MDWFGKHTIQSLKPAPVNRVILAVFRVNAGIPAEECKESTHCLERTSVVMPGCVPQPWNDSNFFSLNISLKRPGHGRTTSTRGISSNLSICHKVGHTSHSCPLKWVLARRFQHCRLWYPWWIDEVTWIGFTSGRLHAPTSIQCVNWESATLRVVF